MVRKEETQTMKTLIEIEYFSNSLAPIELKSLSTIIVIEFISSNVAKDVKESVKAFVPTFCNHPRR